MTTFMRCGALIAALFTAACGSADDTAGHRAGTASESASTAASGTSLTAAGDVAPAQSADTVPGAEGPRRVIAFGVDLTGVGYDRGSPTAPVVVVNFSDFGCPYCAQFAQESEPVIDEEYVRTGKVFMKYVPFVMGMFPNGAQATRAAECAGDQGKFKEMHDRLYAGQAEWKRTSDPTQLFTGYASKLKLKRDAFSACYARPGMHARTIRANEAAKNLGIRATPSFIVNGRGLEGAPPLQTFRELLDAAREGRL